MSQERRCPQCGADLPANTPHGLCPACLLGQGIESQRPTEDSPPAPQGSSSTGAFIPPSPADLAPRFPQLEILELLGQGGMGAVYKARQPDLDRLVALKILPPGIGQDPAFAERFKREARSLARLNHPNIVAVHDFGQAGGQYYFLMEYVDGVSLRQLERAERPSPKQALGIVMQICEALQYAHEEGVVHRDIKPENILLDKKGRVKIADFGLAKLLGRGPADFTLTQPQQVMGTPHYMAPEQMEHPAEVDQRADIYSLGVVFYEMLTGELPLGRFAPPSKKVEIDVRLDEVVLKALEKEPSRRYQHASEVKTDVEEISRGPQAAAAPVPAAPRSAAIDPAVRRRLRWPAIGLLVTGILYCLSMPLLALALDAAFWGGPASAGPMELPLALAGSPGPLRGHGHPYFWASSQTFGELFRQSLPGIFILLGWLALGLAAGVLIIVGSVKMKRMRSSGWARTSAVLAMSPFPNPVTWLLGLPMGIWALRALARPEIKAALAPVAQAREGMPVSPADRVRRPATGMIVGAAINVAFLFVILGIFLAFYSGVEYAVGILAMSLGAIGTGVLIIVGAWQMMRLRSYRLAVAASALSFVAAAGSLLVMPLALGSLLGLPFGIWALVVLLRPDVRAAFASAAAQRQDVAKEPAERLRWPAVGLLVAAIGSLVASLVAVPGFSGLGNVVHIEHGVIVLISLGSVAYGVLLFVPAIALLGLRWRWVAVAGNIFAMLPISPAVVIGAPAAIWGLVALGRPEVRAAFAAEAEKAAMGAPSRRQARRMGLALVAWLALGVGMTATALWLTGEYVPARYIVQDVFHLDPIPATMPVQGSAGTYSAHRGYLLQCTATGEGRTWGRDPPNRGLERQRLVLRFLPPNSGPPSASRVLGQMEIDLRTLGYKYRGRDGVETAAETGLDPKVILAWMKAGGAGELVAGPGFPAELLKEAGPDGPRARSEAANLDELARNWRWLFPQEKIDRAIFVPLYGFQSQQTVDPDPWAEPAVWIILAAAWLALGALWLRRLRRPQAKASLAVAGGGSAGGPAVTQEGAPQGHTVD